MTPLPEWSAGTAPAAKVARRDWLLLPAIGLATVLVLAASMELVARRLFSTTTTSFDDCLILSEPATGIRGIPNSVCREKIMESELVEYRLDSAGFRSAPVSKPKPPGVYRIVMIGSSLATGERVPVEKTLAALLPVALARQSGRRVELYNEGMAYGFPRNTALRFDAVLAAEPDLILWLLTPTDVERVRFAYTKTAFDKPAATDGAMSALKTAVLGKIRKAGGTIVIGHALRHWLYEMQSQNQYVRAYTLGKPEDSEAGFLRAKLSADWMARVKEFGVYAADIQTRARAAGVPLVATLTPNRAQAAMISLGEWPAGLDPYSLNQQVQAEITRTGATYLDILPGFRSLPSPEHFFFPLDGHPDAAGHAALSGLLTHALGDAVPELRAINHPAGPVGGNK
jgi:hypothetical protein